MEELLSNRSVPDIVGELTYNTLNDLSKNSFVTLLVYTGYITRDPTKADSQLKIPNKEIKLVFEGLFRNKFKKLIKSTNTLLQHLSNEDIKGLETNIQNELNLQSFDILTEGAVKNLSESSYHNMLFVYFFLCISYYDRFSTPTTSIGKPDILLAPIRDCGLKTAYIFELKYVTDENKLENESQVGIEQIVTKNYNSYFSNQRNFDFVNKIICIGLSFCKKKLYMTHIVSIPKKLIELYKEKIEVSNTRVTRSSKK